MAIFRNFCVRLIPPRRDSKYFNVFLRLKSLPSLTLQKISHFRTSSQSTIDIINGFRLSIRYHRSATDKALC